MARVRRRRGAAARRPPSQDGEGNAASLQTRSGTEETGDLGAGRRQAGRWREEWEKRGFGCRPAPSCGIRKNDRDLVSRGTEQGAKDEQEGFGLYESEVGRLLVGAYLRCRDRRTRGFVGCGGRPKWGRRRQRKLARRQEKLARRQRKLARRQRKGLRSQIAGTAEVK